MNPGHYETCRQAMIELHTKAAGWAMKQASLLDRAARKLKMAAPDGTLLFEDQEDMSVLAEALLYETSIGGTRTISAFFKANQVNVEIDQNLSVAMGKASFGLYRVESTEPSRSEVTLHGLVATSPDAALTNSALSETIQPGQVLALRVIELPELNMASGVIFPFHAEKEKRLVREWWSKQGIERIALFRKLFRRDGIPYVSA